MKLVLLFAAVAFFSFSCNTAQTDTPSDLLSGEFIDLTHEFSEETLYWVTAERFKRTTVFEGHTDGGFYYTAYNFSGAEHGGTHIDAPIHFAEGRKTVDEIGLDQLIGPGVKISVREKAAADRDYLISTEDIRIWEKQNGQVPEGSILLFETGFHEKWPNAVEYLGTARRGEDAVNELSFPGLHPDAAKWLVENRKIKAVGIDTASIDHGRSTDFRAHVELMDKNIPAFENVAALSSLPAKGFSIIALPMKIKGGSGGPLRIIAIVNR
jgi:kynurenine formamidase